MKCIKSIKSTKNVEVGTIKRVREKEADSEVKSGYWKYIPKSEYKLSMGKQKSTDQEIKEQRPTNVEGSNESNKTNTKKIKNGKKTSK